MKLYSIGLPLVLFCACSVFAQNNKQLCSIQLYNNNNPLELREQISWQESNGHESTVMDAGDANTSSSLRVKNITRIYSRASKVEDKMGCIGFAVKYAKRWLKDKYLRAKIEREELSIDDLRICYAYPMTFIECYPAEAFYEREVL